MTTTRARCDGSPGKQGQYEETRTQYSDGSEIVIKINCKGCVTCRPCERCGGTGTQVCSRMGHDVAAAEGTCGECGFWHFRHDVRQVGSHVERDCPDCQGKGTR